MRSASLFAFAVLAVLVLSAAMPAIADINLLQNPGFETGLLDPYWHPHVISEGEDWDWGVSKASSWGPGPHGGQYFAWITGVGGGVVEIYQNIDPPQCAQYLEFWYAGQSETGGGAQIYYSDGTHQDASGILSNTQNWKLAHLDLITAKLVEKVEVGPGPNSDQFQFDDFDLEACPEEAVGGVVIPANTLALVAPWLAVIGLVGCIGTAVVVRKKRR
jgi:hypothetical protein